VNKELFDRFVIHTDEDFDALASWFDDNQHLFLSKPFPTPYERGCIVLNDKKKTEIAFQLCGDMVKFSVYHRGVTPPLVCTFNFIFEVNSEDGSFGRGFTTGGVKIQNTSEYDENLSLYVMAVFLMFEAFADFCGDSIVFVRRESISSKRSGRPRTRNIYTIKCLADEKPLANLPPQKPSGTAYTNQIANQYRNTRNALEKELRNRRKRKYDYEWLRLCEEANEDEEV
jgi:hypothetical protein